MIGSYCSCLTKRCSRQAARKGDPKLARARSRGLRLNVRLDGRTSIKMSSQIIGRRRKHGDGCEAPGHDGHYASLQTIVRAYRARFREHSQQELESFAVQSRVEAIKRAGLAVRPDGKRYNHQRRIPGDVLEESAKQLRRAKLDRARTFDELHEMVKGAIGSIPGIGTLTVYDTALRIGATLSLAPTRVYLHTGTRAGARKLGLNWRADSLVMTAIPAAFRELEPREVEDVLCIFEDHFDQLRDWPSNKRLQPTARVSSCERASERTRRG